MRDWLKNVTSKETGKAMGYSVDEGIENGTVILGGRKVRSLKSNVNAKRANAEPYWLCFSLVPYPMRSPRRVCDSLPKRYCPRFAPFEEATALDG